MNADHLLALLPILCIIAVFLVAYTIWVRNLFRTRKDGSQRRWRRHDWIWVPLAGISGALLLALWWHLRPNR